MFSGADDPYDDPYEWDGLVPIAPSSDFSMPGVGIWTFGNDDIDRHAATQAVYDLAVEAQNKAGDWSLSHSDDGEGIYLLNDNGLLSMERQSSLMTTALKQSRTRLVTSNGQTDPCMRSH